MQKSDSEILNIDCFLQNRLLCPLLRWRLKVGEPLISTWGHIIVVPLRPRPAWIKAQSLQRSTTKWEANRLEWLYVKSDTPTRGYDQEDIY